MCSVLSDVRIEKTIHAYNLLCILVGRHKQDFEYGGYIRCGISNKVGRYTSRMCILHMFKVAKSQGCVHGFILHVLSDALYI